MHELSLAVAVLERAMERVPAGTRLRSVRIRAGPRRGIDRPAMELAWRAATADTPASQTTLVLELLPWNLLCPECGRRWQAQDPLDPCPCGTGRAGPVAGDELTLMSIDVDDPEDA